MILKGDLSKLNRMWMIVPMLFMLFGQNLHAQFYNGSNLTFGQNRVQYQKLNWFFYRNNRCDVYFYPKGKQIAQYVLKYGNQEIEQFEQNFGTGLSEKIQFIIYANFSDFKESNIGLINENLYNTGGNTLIAENKVFLYFNDGYRDLDKQIRAGVASIYINELFQGSSLYQKMKSSAILSLPDWVFRGLVSYYAERSSDEMDNKIRDLVVSGRYSKLNLLNKNELEIAGNAIWSYYALKYGSNSIPITLNSIRSSRSVERGFMYGIGLGFKDFFSQSIAYYTNKYVTDNIRSMPDSATVVKYKKETQYYGYKQSTDGKAYAYVSNIRGKYKVWLKKPDRKRPVKIFKRNHKIDDNPDCTIPLLAWNHNGTILTMALEEKGKLFFYNYSLEDETLSRFEIYNIAKINTLAYAHDGKNIVFSGVKDGNPDIFIYNLTSRSYTQITEDRFDDTDPEFINESTQIMFSSNRTNDTIGAKQALSRSNLTGTTRLYIYDLKSKSTTLRKVTDGRYGTESKPLELKKNTFLFLSNKNGITNSYIGKFDSTLSHIDTTVHYRFYSKISPYTDFRSSILEHSFNKATNHYNTTLWNKGVKKFYFQGLTSSPTNYGSFLSDGASLKEQKYILDTTRVDSLNNKSKLKTKKRVGKRLVSVKMSEAYVDCPGVIFSSGNQNFIQFGDTNRKEISIGEELKPESMEQNAYTQYSISQIVSQVDFSFMNTSYQQFTGGGSPIYLNPGFNALFMVGTQDLLENHRLIGGVRFTLNFDNTEFMLSYETLEKRLDRQMVFHRQQLKQFNEYFGVKQLSNSLFYILKWPFSRVNAVRGTLIGRSDKQIFLSLENNTLKEPNQYGFWGGLKGEWIFDNSRELAPNIYEGARTKIFAEYYQSVEKTSKNLFVFGADARYYFRLYRNFIWANRIAASTSVGKNKLVYYMGGVDNWLFAKFNQNINVDMDQNYSFQTLATNMRGFTQNIRNGNSFAVINSELRIPIVKFIFNKSFNSDFVNNFQFNIFGDIGTAWTGISPYSDDNSLYTQIIRSGPITVTLNKQVEPIVGGYGFGIRTKLLGYFIRADWAWGIENYKVQPRVFYLSLNLDF